jgi:hypothetical protein
MISTWKREETAGNAQNMTHLSRELRITPDPAGNDDQLSRREMSVTAQAGQPLTRDLPLAGAPQLTSDCSALSLNLQAVDPHQ